ncbi:MAG: ABC-F family ATP-binding cassette domain-containing protein [Oscillospiraceae bacterium]|nr:ABC-F family ATP-binding cassette domain-containing protein [Oscillospiraceae bacterium]
MIDIAVSNLVKSFQIGENVLDGLTFQVNEGERVGILGRNGSGKTTLFRILTGAYLPDEGDVVIAPGKRIGLISQIPVYPPEFTVKDVLDTAFARIHAMEEELKQLTEQMESGDYDEAVLRRFDRLSDGIALSGGYDVDVRLSKVCNGLGIPREMRERPFDALSGGEKTRINLARLILEDTDILLLDEPTNHLDLHAVEWLEDYVSHFKGTVLTISHDRYFLDRCVDRIVALNEGKAEFYSGNYSFYVVERERRYQERMKQYEKERAKIEQLTRAADQMHLWAFMGNDKLHKRAFSMEKRIEKMRTTDKPRREQNLKQGFRSTEFHGDLLFSVEGLRKSFGDKTLFSDLNLEVLGGERIALLGDNGTGKTTFLKLLLREEKPDWGLIHFGPTVKVGYLPQIVRFAHPERNLVDTLIYEKDCSAQEARDQLAAFRFRGEDVFKPVSALSGGELSRLKLCMLMMDSINLLVLDEPTNHLDVSSREWIEEAVEDFEGALLFVSNDRYFINRFASRIWTLENGKISDFRGDYDAYRAKLAREEELRSVLKPTEAAKPKKDKPKAKSPGGTKNLEKQLRALERDIARAEEQLAALDGEMEANATDYQKLQALTQEREAAETRLNELYEQWEELSLQLEEAQA